MCNRRATCCSPVAAPPTHPLLPPPTLARLGLYAALEAAGPCTPAQLAAAAGGLSERYVAEWLRQQAAARLVATDEQAEQVGGRVGAGHAPLWVNRSRSLAPASASHRLARPVF